MHSIDLLVWYNILQKKSQHRKESETLQLQQQSPTGSTAPPTTQPQPTISTADRLSKLTSLCQPWHMHTHHTGTYFFYRSIANS